MKPVGCGGDGGVFSDLLEGDFRFPKLYTYIEILSTLVFNINHTLMTYVFASAGGSLTIIDRF